MAVVGAETVHPVRGAPGPIRSVPGPHGAAPNSARSRLPKRTYLNPFLGIISDKGFSGSSHFS